MKRIPLHCAICSHLLYWLPANSTRHIIRRTMLFLQFCAFLKQAVFLVNRALIHRWCMYHYTLLCRYRTYDTANGAAGTKTVEAHYLQRNILLKPFFGEHIDNDTAERSMLIKPL